ncbi:MAG: pseudouridine synthase, partial [Bacteroidota bacterium]
MKNKPTILFEDEHILLVNKPAHFLSIPDRFALDQPNLLHFFRRFYPDLFVVHRLDRETSGIICFA